MRLQRVSFQSSTIRRSDCAQMSAQVPNVWPQTSLQRSWALLKPVRWLCIVRHSSGSRIAPLRASRGGNTMAHKRTSLPTTTDVTEPTILGRHTSFGQCARVAALGASFTQLPTWTEHLGRSTTFLTQKSSVVRLARGCDFSRSGVVANKVSINNAQRSKGQGSEVANGGSRQWRSYVSSIRKKHCRSTFA